MSSTSKGSPIGSPPQSSYKLDLGKQLETEKEKDSEADKEIESSV